MNQAAEGPACIVLIAAPDLLPTLKQRLLEAGGDLLAFSDTEALRALEAISRRHPRVVALEGAFAETRRGAALINRLKADPALSASEIRIVSTDGRPSTMAVAPTPPAPPPSVVARAAPLDKRGTRRAPRFKIALGIEIAVDGKTAALMDLSTVGAHVVSPTVLKPNQRIRLTFTDDQAAIRVAAVVVWASFEMPPKIGPRYRAGLDFLDANAAAIDAFRTRHQA